MSKFSSPYGDYDLERYPASNDPNLQAWEAADRYLLTTLAGDLVLPEGPTVICNDQFGAVTTALHARRPFVWNDSALAHRAIATNFERNRLATPWTAVPSTEQVPVAAHSLALVLIKLPKSLSFLEDQLARLRDLVSSQTVVIGAAKVKHIHTSTLELFERYIGPTTTSLAKQKARLVFAAPSGQAGGPSPWPRAFDYAGRPVLGHAGVFSHRRLDIGTRLLLEELERGRWAEEAEAAIDLGCGNGLLGLQAIRQNEKLSCTFIDRSHMAIDSARRNVHEWFPSHEQHSFVLADSLGSVEDPERLVVAPESVDLILCNPPFHDNYLMGQQTASKMFRHAAAVLRPGGRLLVVANRHLRYQQTLRRFFKSCEVVASNRKFVATLAQGKLNRR